MYAIQIVSCPTDSKLPAIRLIREAFGLGLKDTSDMFKEGVITFPNSASFPEVVQGDIFTGLAARLRGVGLVVEVDSGYVKPVRFDVLEGIPNRAQRQDSATDQLKDLIKVGNRLGMYDAVDTIKGLFRL